MDFGDPLADLSDGSNDSFFDEPKPVAKRSSLSKTPEKKLVTDLFNIGDKSQESKKTDDWLGLDSKETKKSPLKRTMSKKISFDDDDDLLGSLGMNSKRPQSRNEETTTDDKSKKVDLFESILGPTKSEDSIHKKSSLGDILKESKVATVKPSTEEVPREGRRGRRLSGSLKDPLGLFSNEPKPEPEMEISTPKPVISKSTPNLSDQGGLPNWLGGSAVKQSKSENVLIEKTPEVPKERVPEEHNIDMLMTQQKLAQSNLEYQNTSIAMQQQESQILMALQLKKYEENMSEMQLKQQEILMKQEQQFNTLLERQFAKQQIMENNLRLQQERINNHIQMLIAQPPITKHTGQEEVDNLKKSTSEESVKLYENLISSLKQRQHEETFLLEESYKKQISLLEQSLETVEKRLKNDVDKISEVFEEKLNLLQMQHNEEVVKYKNKLQEVEVFHAEEIKQIREYSTRVIEEIKFEHATLLENIKEAKRSEASLLQDSNSYLQKLDSNIEILYNNSKNLQEIRESVESNYGILSKAREESLKAKEKEISMMRETLEKCRGSAELERAELLGLVRSLETKIAEQNQNAREERWAFQQAASTLAARSAALDREAEFNRASIERERDQLKTLKENISAEQEKMMLQITEEKLSLAAEKSRLETSSKLITNYDSQKLKSEMEAAIQVAKEAAEMTDKERENLHREKCELEKFKRTLLDQERKLHLRETELENLMKEAERKILEGEKAILESKSIENKYNERLRDLQSQLILLSNRERKIAQEKIALSKERLVINTAIRQNKKCGLCNVEPQIITENEFNTNFVPPFYPAENDLLRIRLAATDDDHSLNLPEENLTI